MDLTASDCPLFPVLLAHTRLETQPLVPFVQRGLLALQPLRPPSPAQLALIPFRTR